MLFAGLGGRSPKLPRVAVILQSTCSNTDYSPTGCVARCVKHRNPQVQGFSKARTANGPRELHRGRARPSPANQNSGQASSLKSPKFLQMPYVVGSGPVSRTLRVLTSRLRTAAPLAH